MQTSWDGFGCTDDNVFTTAVLTAWRRSLQLSDTPGIPTAVLLPATAHGVRIWTSDASIYYALDVIPDPEPGGPFTGLSIDFSAFNTGDVLLPSQWQRFSLPDDSLTHTVYFTSKAISPILRIIVLVESI